jgi:uncharacterized protein (DUF1501 family)
VPWLIIICVLTSYRSLLNSIQQLVVTTAEFVSTNRITHSGEKRTTTANPPASTEPYKAVIYFYLSGGCDSYNMLVPMSCSPVDVYSKYRRIRGKSDIAEGLGLPLKRLLEVQANNIQQPCSTFGIHENLTSFKELYGRYLFSLLPRSSSCFSRNNSSLLCCIL